MFTFTRLFGIPSGQSKLVQMMQTSFSGKTDAGKRHSDARNTRRRKCHSLFARNLKDPNFEVCEKRQSLLGRSVRRNQCCA